MKTKETEERKGKCEESKMFEDKKRQCFNVCTQKTNTLNSQQRRSQMKTTSDDIYLVLNILYKLCLIEIKIDSFEVLKQNFW